MRPRLNLERFRISVWSRKESLFSRSKMKRGKRNSALRENLRSLRLMKVDGGVELSSSPSLMILHQRGQPVVMMVDSLPALAWVPQNQRKRREMKVLRDPLLANSKRPQSHLTLASLEELLVDLHPRKKKLLPLHPKKKKRSQLAHGDLVALRLNLVSPLQASLVVFHHLLQLLISLLNPHQVSPADSLVSKLNPL